MMAGPGCVLLQTAEGWSIATPQGEAVVQWGDVAPPELAQRAADFVSQRQLSADQLLLALSSDSVLAAGFTLPLVDQRDRRTLCYQMESRLPLAAEDFAADFIRDGEQVLGVCIDIRQWLPVVSALEARGLRVQSISAAALLALQSHFKERGGNVYDLVLWHEAGRVELWRTRQEKVAGWQHLTADPQTLARHLAVESLGASEPLTVLLINGPATLRTELDAIGLAELRLVTLDDKSLSEHALEQAQAVLGGKEVPWVELRRGVLAAGDPYRNVRRPLRLLAAAAAIFLVTLTAVFFVKARQYENELARLNRQQEEYYRSAFPGSRVPAAIVARMKSEQAKLVGSHQTAEDVDIPLPALRVLLELLRAIPTGERFAIRELRIEDGQVDLDVRLRQHASVNQFVGALESHGFLVNAPSTAREDDTSVACRIFGTLELASGPREDAP
jgi:type II secretory pathway component PulL